MRECHRAGACPGPGRLSMKALDGRQAGLPVGMDTAQWSTVHTRSCWCGAGLLPLFRMLPNRLGNNVRRGAAAPATDSPSRLVLEAAGRGLDRAGIDRMA